MAQQHPLTPPSVTIAQGSLPHADSVKKDTERHLGAHTHSLELSLEAEG